MLLIDLLKVMDFDANIEVRFYNQKFNEEEVIYSGALSKVPWYETLYELDTESDGEALYYDNEEKTFIVYVKM